MKFLNLMKKYHNIFEGEGEDLGGQAPAAPVTPPPAAESDDPFADLDFNLDAGNEDEPNDPTAQTPEGSQAQTTPTPVEPVVPNVNGQQGEQQSAEGQNPPTQGNNGDLVDPLTGEVIAKAGPERRQFYKLTNQYADAQRQLQLVNTELTALKQANEQFKTIGLDQANLLSAAQFYQKFMADPQSFTTNLLAEMKANGYNLDGQASSIDLNAVSQIIDNKLKPLTSVHEAQTQEVERTEAGKREVAAFFNKFPEAPQHEQVLVTMLQNDPELDLYTAYSELRVWAAKNQYDLSQPLAPQVQARNAQRVPNTGNPPSNTPPINFNGVNNQSVTPPTPTVANASDSFASIIKGAMNDNGLNYS